MCNIQINKKMTESAVTETKNLGCVKWFNGKRGYGFITDMDSQADVFVHHTGLTTNKDCWKNLLKGEYVEYSLTTGSDGENHATSVTGVRGGPLMCESNAEDIARRRNRSRSRRSAEDGGEEENVESA